MKNLLKDILEAASKEVQASAKEVYTLDLLTNVRVEKEKDELLFTQELNTLKEGYATIYFPTSEDDSEVKPSDVGRASCILSCKDANGRRVNPLCPDDKRKNPLFWRWDYRELDAPELSQYWATLDSGAQIPCDQLVIRTYREAESGRIYHRVGFSNEELTRLTK